MACATIALFIQSPTRGHAHERSHLHSPETPTHYFGFDWSADVNTDLTSIKRGRARDKQRRLLMDTSASPNESDSDEIEDEESKKLPSLVLMDNLPRVHFSVDAGKPSGRWKYIIPKIVFKFRMS